MIGFDVAGLRDSFRKSRHPFLFSGTLMRKLLIAAAAMLVVSAAHADDVVAGSRARVAQFPASSNWTGFYIGVNAGFGFGDRTAAFSGGDPLIQAFTAGTGFGTGTPIPPDAFRLRSATGGVQVGYNFQVAPQWLAGLEADFNGLNFNAAPASAFGFGIIASGNTLFASQKADWFGTVRGRFGWLPAESLLVYGTGGLAYGRVKETLVFNQKGTGGGNNAVFGYDCVGTGDACFVGSSSKIAMGYTIGAGLEFAVTRNVTLKAEYLYVNLGSTGVRAFTVVPRAGGFAPASFVADFGGFSFNVVRAGLNYKF